MVEWFDGFFDGLYADALPKLGDPKRALQQARIVRRLLGVRKGQSVLDVPCGAGRITLPMARMGLEMTGADLTASYLRHVRRRARREGLAIRCVQSDMRAIAFDAEFDGAFNWGGSFGYFSDAGNLAFCERVFAALKPGGRFVVDALNKSWLLTHFLPRIETTHGGVRVVMRNRWHAPTHRVRSTWTLSKGDVTERHPVTIRIFNGKEIRALLRSAGFREIKLFSWPPVGRFTRHSMRLTAVARKPARPRPKR
jgi:ubiquinone/menaquinone biosynthesis C-methylase UbiE